MPIPSSLSLVAAAAMLSAILSPQPIWAQSNQSDGRHITVHATGTTTVPPDMATMTLGVVSQDESAELAMKRNNQSMSELIDALKKRDIADADIQTSNFSVNPVYNRPDPRAPRQQPPDKPDIVGYTVSNSVTVRIRDLGAIGKILDEIISLGANSVSGPNFAVADPKPHQDAARRAAVAAATGEAQLYAQAAGVELGAIVSIQNQGGAGPRPVMMAARADAAGANVPIQAGELTYSATIQMVWDID